MHRPLLGLGHAGPQFLPNVFFGPDFLLQNKIRPRADLPQMLSEPPTPTVQVSTPHPDPSGPCRPNPTPTPARSCEGPTCGEAEEAGRAWSAASEPGVPGLGYKATPARPAPVSPTFSDDLCPFPATDPLAGTYI
ncbi:hypothetical protein P7K49_023283 [Saguinus oedipus]|uniref:Uncharacterized protein n=1 Tax=Saguinus oedipus TaxID=9490 RepID=A0ABQ9UL70_SAGOE|nr:hypothetical protein P7K49_023283 [Saguinus oedipus]